MSRIDIVVCPDKQYIMPTGVMICSVCANNLGAQIVFHVVIDPDVSAKDCADLEVVVGQFDNKSITFYPFKEEVKRTLPSIGRRITRAACYRLFLADILPKTIEKVLYLDGDIIVRHSLCELWNRDLSGFAIAAVPDSGTKNIEWYNRLGYSPDLGYFNSGVLLINLKIWRRNNITKAFMDYLKDSPEALMLYDQDVLNVVLREKKLTLPIKYNLQERFLRKDALDKYQEYVEDIMEARADPVILHFTEGNKPWLVYQRTPHPFRRTFLKYQNMTKWQGARVEVRSSSMIIRNTIGDALRRMKIRPAIKSNYVEIAPIE